jgi:hypothetical protein
VVEPDPALACPDRRSLTGAPGGAGQAGDDDRPDGQVQDHQPDGRGRRGRGGERKRQRHGEHQLFERYAGRAREARRNGSVTILVSHRFSTVRMADLIVVLDGARVAETGSHDELLARGGRYAELYQIQARAYQ